MDQNRDYFVKDISPNCDDIAMVAETGGNDQYEVLHYNLNKKRLKKISRSQITNSGNPIFSRDGKFIAHTSEQTLIVWDIITDSEISIYQSAQNILNFSFSQDGSEIFIQESDGKISSLNLAKNTFEKLWMPDRPVYPPYSIKVFQENLFFTSDHDSQFSQIYQLNLHDNRTLRIKPESYDQSDPIPYEKDLLYRYSKEGAYCLNSVTKNDLVANVPCDGILYGIFPKVNATKIVYSNYKLPASIYLLNPDKSLSNLLNIQNTLELKKPSLLKTLKVYLITFSQLIKLQTR